MECPFCKVEMIKGYLQCGTALWSTKKHKLSMLPGKNEQYAFYVKLPMVSSNYIESDCCPKCKRLIIDTSDYKNNLEYNLEQDGE